MWISRKKYDEILNKLSSAEKALSNTTDLLNKVEEKLHNTTESFRVLQIEFLKKIDDSSVDPTFKQIRQLMPDEVTDIVNQALFEVKNNPNGLHSECHKTIVLIAKSMS
jgi:hypothetical protein